MPIFTAVGAAVAGGLGFAAGSTGFLIAQSIVAAGAAALAGNAFGVFDEFGGGINDPGVDQRVGADPTNRIPILYGNFVERGIVTYFEVSEDRKTLYAVITLGEGPVTSFSTVYWDDLRLTLDSEGEVTNAVDSEGEETTRLNGLVNIQLYRGTATGNNSTYLEGLSEAWNSTHKMTNLAYAVVTVKYDRDKDVTGINDIRFTGVAAIDDPAVAVRDLLQNPRYGLGYSDSLINIASFTTATAYFQQMLQHITPEGTVADAKRFTINGSISSEASVKERVEAIVKSCNSSLQWDGGQYKFFVDKAETPLTYTFSDDNIIGNVQITERGLDALVNKVEITYGRNAGNNWQPNEVIYEFPTASRHPNEPEHSVSLRLPLISTSVEAERAAVVLLNQVRQQLVVRHRADVTAMPLEPGDVVPYTKSEFGWNGKLFRIIRIKEVEESGGLQYDVEAVEYAASIYADRMFTEADAAPNVGSAEVLEVLAVNNLMISSVEPNAAVPNFTLQWSVPNSLINSFTIFINTANNFSTASSLTTVRNSEGPYNANASVSHVVSGVDIGDYFLWVVGHNDFSSSPESNVAALSGWMPVGATGDIFEEVYRFHGNLTTNDPGAPTGPNGTGGGWAEQLQNPRWEAVGQAREIDGQNRVVEFDLSGMGGEVDTTEVDVPQQYQWDPSGTPGNRTLQYSARPEITQFTFSGTTASVVSEDPGLPEIWQIACTGSSDATVTSLNISEEFYIYLTGNSATSDTTDTIDEISNGDQFQFRVTPIDPSTIYPFNINGNNINLPMSPRIANSVELHGSSHCSEQHK